MYTLLKKIRLTRMQLFLLFLLSVMIQLVFSYKLKGFEGDLRYWKSWMISLGDYRLSGIYVHDDTVNYPPVFLTALWIYHFFVERYTGLTLKLPVILMDLLSLGAVVSMFLKIRWTSRKYRLLVLYLFFSPTVLYISSVWGQVDFVHSSLMALSLVSLLYSPVIAGAFFAFALLTKLQAVVIAPAVALYLFKRLSRKDWKFAGQYAAGFAAPWLLYSLYFSFYHSFGAFIRQSYLDAVGYYPYVSLYAMNIWFNLIGVAPDTADNGLLMPNVTYRTFGFLLLGAFAVFALFYLRSFRQIREIHLLKTGFLLTFAFYMLPTEIHDRYIIPAVILLIFIAFLEKKRIWFFLLAAMEANTVLSLTIFLKKSKYPWLDHFGTAAAAVFLILFILSVAICWREIQSERRIRMRHPNLRKIVLLCSLLCPNVLKIYLYRKLFRWNIGKGVRIGFSWLEAEYAEIGNGVRIGHFNFMKNLRFLKMGNSSYMLNLNAVAAGQYDGWSRELKIGEHTGIMSRHFFDASGGIELGDRVVMAGRSSQIWTHEKQGGIGQLAASPVSIGSDSYVAAGVLIAPGVKLGSHSVVALGCVVKKDTYEERVILVGNPTQIKRKASAAQDQTRIQSNALSR